jgi:hypothetical protein
MSVEALAVLSDQSGFRMSDEQFSYWGPNNTTYPRPLGQRGPFRYGAGFYSRAEMRFAEAEALARRVYASDLEPLKNLSPDVNNPVDVKKKEGSDGTKRKLAHLKVRAKDGRIEWMELSDDEQHLLGKIAYEYDGSSKGSHLTRLIADMAPKPEKLAIDINGVLTSPNVATGRTEEVPVRMNEVDHVYHKGGRVCIVNYQDVDLGGATLRLPVRVEVRRGNDKWLVHSARFVNFKRVDLDKAAVWEAAKAFGGLSSEDRSIMKLRSKFLDHTARLGPPRIDPNDFGSIRRLIAKYPVPESTRGPAGQTPQGQEASTRAKPVDVEPNDARVIRQCIALYSRSKPSGSGRDTERGDLWSQLRRVRSYHHFPVLPEDKPPEPNDSELGLIRQLQAYYEPLAAQKDGELGGQLKALNALGCLDLVRKDYDAFERHTARYLQTVQDANLMGLYMVGGYVGFIDGLVKAGQYDRANKLMRPWVDRSVLANDADAVYRFCNSHTGGKPDPWMAVQLLDRFLKKPGLSSIEKYEGLALRAISLDKLAKLLATPLEDMDPLSDQTRQAQWVLSATSKAALVKRAEPAVREAVAAWRSLGAARLAEAKPYSTDAVPAVVGIRTVEATRLQEISAQLNKIASQQSGPRGTAPRSANPAPRSGGARRSGAR